MSKLDDLVACLHSDRVYIQMHNYPDQDAFASALGLKRLLERRNIKSCICYDGLVEKDDTLKMIELCGINSFMISQLDVKPDDDIILVDVQKDNSNITPLPGRVVGCIDHHFSFQNQKYPFKDIRSKVGACASIIASYFLEENYEMSTTVATALLSGIRSDTRNMCRSVSELDLDMFSRIYMIANLDHIRYFDNNSLRRDDLKAFSEAIQNLEIVEGLGIAKVGNECSDAIMASVADFLLTLMEVQYSVLCCRKNGGVRISIRSEEDRVDASAMIINAFEGIEGAGGGGHADMAAGFIKNIKDVEEAEKIIAKVRQKCIQFVRRVKNTDIEAADDIWR